MQNVCVIKASRALVRIGPDLIGLDRIRSDQTLYRRTSCALVRIGSNQTSVLCAHVGQVIASEIVARWAQPRRKRSYRSALSSSRFTLLLGSLSSTAKFISVDTNCSASDS